MTKTILNIKTDPSTKQQIQEFAAELGVPVSVIMNAQIKQMLRDRKIVLSTELEPTPYLIKIIDTIELFINGPFNESLRNHPLKDKWVNYRSITADNDLRLHYRVINKDTALFAAVGTHDQLYK